MAQALVIGGTSIIIAGQPVDVGRPVVLWNEPEGFDGYSQTCHEKRYAESSKCCQYEFNRFGKRKNLKSRDLESLRQVVSQFVLHLDGCVNSRSCFYSMHDTPRPDGGCGLSAHFMVDGDGTIYQTLDLLESAWHAEQSNGISVGVEICNRGDASRNELERLPAEYRTRPVKDVVINGHTFHAFDFRPEQYESIIALARVLVRTFPNIKPLIPERNGEPLLETLREPSLFKGILGHLHVDLQKHKWDPGAFDWHRLLRGLHGYYLPVAIRSYLQIPEERAGMQAVLNALYRNSEERATGHFPVAPLGLWHSGAHLRGVQNEPVYAPVRGKIVAARKSTKRNPHGGFVLLRHDVEIEKSLFTFFSLLAHLGPQDMSDATPVNWIRELHRRTALATLAGLEEGKVVLLDQTVEAGDVLGTLGRLRRGWERGPELHFEIFSADKPPAALAKQFRVIMAAADGLFIRRGAVLDPLLAADPSLRAESLQTFFREGDPQSRQAFRRFAIRHQHEWGDRFRASAFLDAPEVKTLSEEQRRSLYEAVWAPFVFWSDALSKHTGLPVSQVIYSYHPVTFLMSLAALSQNVTLHWPGRGGTSDKDVDRTPLQPGTLADWLDPQAADDDGGPVFGKVVRSEVASKKQADIPLIVLPDENR